MADSKRNSVAGKIAVPKAAGTPTPSSAPPMMDQLEALGKSIGARIKITTAAPHSQTYEGTLFTACPTLNIVAIDTRSNSAQGSTAQPGDYHMFTLSKIQSFQVLSTADTGNAGNSIVTAPIAPVDTKRLQQKAQARIDKLKEAERDQGKGVSKEAQAIFDSLKRINMPVRWHMDQMIVHDAIIITPPYRVEDCKAPKEKQEVLIRVKRVLEGERKKLKEKEDRERKAATPVGPRKGG
ncbi:uncharacterized protein LTR77_006418 [Saxophila tyrrhenica]|uniref:AD domain-containing protein n=1 Tax=Saxophila tyrrhenica TaxID=1690608 RepID=A0AAV9P7U5_9PEZI|nr:hypothetical protein LTR77_006418 [Saxophila tyrrhenica]